MLKYVDAEQGQGQNPSRGPEGGDLEGNARGLSVASEGLASETLCFRSEGSLVGHLV